MAPSLMMFYTTRGPETHTHTHSLFLSHTADGRQIKTDLHTHIQDGAKIKVCY